MTRNQRTRMQNQWRARGETGTLNAAGLGTMLLQKKRERGGAIMNEDILKGKWHEMRGEVKKKWGKLTDDDLTMISGQTEKLLGILQTRYGYAKDKADDEYKKFMSSFKK